MPSDDSDHLSIFTPWSESLLPVCSRIAKNAKLLRVDNKDSGQTAWMSRLIRVFIGHMNQKVYFLILQLIKYSVILMRCCSQIVNPCPTEVVLLTLVLLLLTLVLLKPLQLV